MKEEEFGFDQNTLGSIQYGSIPKLAVPLEENTGDINSTKNKGGLGSVGATFNIISSVLGGGILSFPYAFAAAGAIGGFLTSIILASFAYFSLIIIVITYERYCKSIENSISKH